MVVVAESAAGIVTACPPLMTTATVDVWPSTVSATVQSAPAAIAGYSFETLPASVFAGITKGASALPSHVGTIVIAPCFPAAAPAIVFVTTSEPGTSV